MKTNELKKGDTVELSNGFIAEIMDNKKGNIRLAKVYGMYGEEIGSIYAWDILKFVNRINGNFFPDTFLEEIELTPAQEKAREKVRKALSFL